MRNPLPLLALCTGVLLAGCDPSCTSVCEKLVACEDVDSPRVSWVECTESCEDQERLYEQWTDTVKREGFSEMKSCIEDSECSDIADGECYDEDLYIW
jgi:hypothetical protein